MSMESENTQEKKPRNGRKPVAAPTIELAFTTCEVSIGTKRSDKAIAAGKAHLNVKVELDFTKAPAAINSALLREGYLYLLRQEANKVEKEIDKARSEALEAGTPFSEPDLNALTQQAVNARLEALYSGELGRRRGTLSMVERRAIQLVRDSVAAHFRNLGQPMTNERLDEITAQKWEENSDNLREKATAKAQQLIEEEARRAGELQISF